MEESGLPPLDEPDKIIQLLELILVSPLIHTKHSAHPSIREVFATTKFRNWFVQKIHWTLVRNGDSEILQPLSVMKTVKGSCGGFSGDGQKTGSIRTEHLGMEEIGKHANI